MKDILFIEREKSNLDLYSYFLWIKDYKLVTAKNPDEGISKICFFDPNLIIFDVDIPLLETIRFLNFRRDHTRINTVPTLLLTSSTDDGKETLYKNVKNSHLIQKNCSPTFIIETAKTQLNSYITDQAESHENITPEIPFVVNY